MRHKMDDYSKWDWLRYSIRNVENVSDAANCMEEIVNELEALTKARQKEGGSTPTKGDE